MSVLRLRRLQRVLEIRVSAAHRLEVDLARFVSTLSVLQQLEVTALGAFGRALDGPPVELCTIDDLLASHAYAASLARAHEAAVRAVRTASAQCETCRVQLCRARTEVRKLELWQDRMKSEGAGELGRLERREADELAARIGRAG